MNFASIPENLQFATVSAIDKLDRKSEDEVSDNLKGIGLSTESIRHLFHHLSESEPNNYLKEILKYANGLGVDDDNISFQARLARGLDYYTGLIFEVKIDEYKVGSVLGGGRYDKLIEKLSGTNIPAVGFGLGFDRTLEAMDMLKLFPDEGKRKGVLVTIFSPEFSGASFSTTKSLRDTNIEAEIFPDENAKLEKQLKYADKKGIKWLIVIGPEEVEKNTVILKNLKTGHQEDVKLNDLINKL